MQPIIADVIKRDFRSPQSNPQSVRIIGNAASRTRWRRELVIQVSSSARTKRCPLEPT
jgi:hypothetical protein